MENTILTDSYDQEIVVGNIILIENDSYHKRRTIMVMSITPFVGIPCSIHVTEKKILINNPHRLDLVELSQNFSKGIYKFKKKLHCQDYKIEYAKSINEEEVERFVEETKESIRFMEFANNTAEILKTFKRNHILQFKKFIYDLSIKQ